MDEKDGSCVLRFMLCIPLHTATEESDVISPFFPSPYAIGEKEVFYANKKKIALS